MRALLLLFCFFSFTCFCQQNFGGYIEYNFESSTPDKITTKFSARKLHAGATYNGLHKKVVLKLGIGIRYTFITDVVMPRFQKEFLNDIDKNYTPIESPEYDSLLASSVHNWQTEYPSRADKLSATNLEFGVLFKTRFFPNINISRKRKPRILL